MQKHNDAMKTSDTVLLEKYTSHFIWKGSKGLLKVLRCEKWVGNWTELQHIDPYFYGHNSVFFSVLLACSTGGLGAQPLWDMVLIPASSLQLIWGSELNSSIGGPEAPLCWVLVLSTTSFLQLIWTSCRRGYIIIWRPLFFLRASQFQTQFNPCTVKVISWDSSAGCTCYLHRCISYFDSLVGVSMQQNNNWDATYLLLKYYSEFFIQISVNEIQPITNLILIYSLIN